MFGRRRRRTAPDADLPRSRPLRWLLVAIAAGAGLVACLYAAVRGPLPFAGPADVAVTVLRTAVVLGVPAVLLLLVLYAVWRHRLEILAGRPGPIRVRHFVDRTGGASEALAVEATATFQRRLAETRIYGSTAIPSTGRPSDFLRVVEEAGDNWHGPFGAVGRLVGLLAPTSCYELRCTLLPPPDTDTPAERPCGIMVELARHPGASIAPTVIRARSWDRAIELAVHRVAATILPRTRQCRTPPWTTWSGLRLPAELFDGYQRFQNLRSDRRYDEAMAALRETTLQDPGNLALLLEMGKLQEQTEMYLDALFTYDNIIGRASRRSGRLAGWWNGSGDSEGTWADPVQAPGLPPGHPVVEVARYRHAMLLARGDTLAGQWWDRVERCRAGVHQSARERRRDYLRRTLGARLTIRYAAVADMLSRTTAVRTTVGEYLGPALPNVAEHDRADRALDARIFFTTVAVMEFELLLSERHGRRPRPGGRADHEALPRRALKLCLPYAGLRRAMALAHARESATDHRTVGPPSAARSVLRPDLSLFPGAASLMAEQWPPRVERLAPVVRSIMGDTRTRLRSWPEHYNAASLYAVLLLPVGSDRLDGPHRADPSVEAVRAAVIELEKAVASADGGFVATQQDWLLTEDPDLDRLRGRAEFREFEATTFGSVRRAAQRGPRIGLWEQSTHVTRFIQDAAAQMAAIWKARTPAGASREELVRWVEIEVEAWRLAEKLALDHRDWASRDQVATAISAWEGLVDVRTPARRHPRYSDDRLAHQLASMRGQAEVRRLPRTEGRTLITVADEVRQAVAIADRRIEAMAVAMRADEDGERCCSQTAPRVLGVETAALRNEFVGPVRATSDISPTVVTVWAALSAQRWQALASWFDDRTLDSGGVEVRAAAFVELMRTRAAGA